MYVFNYRLLNTFYIGVLIICEAVANDAREKFQGYLSTSSRDHDNF